MVLALISISLGSIGQLLLKIGVNRLGGLHFGPGPGALRTLWSAAKEPAIVIGVLLFGVSMVVWMAVISAVELSKAYPLVGLSYVFVALLSHFFLGEAITGGKTAGIGLILAGVMLISKQW